MKRIATVVFILLWIIPNCGFGADNVLINISNIAGKTEKEVAKILGNPVSCKQSKYGRTCTYKKNEMEIVFINGNSDWITVNNMGDAQYSKKSLSLLGLPIKDPAFSNSNVMRWTGLNGLHDVSFFPSGQKISYVYIKAFTR